MVCEFGKSEVHFVFLIILLLFPVLHLLEKWVCESTDERALVILDHLWEIILNELWSKVREVESAIVARHELVN